jgi:hypothetical protein
VPSGGLYISDVAHLNSIATELADYYFTLLSCFAAPKEIDEEKKNEGRIKPITRMESIFETYRTPKGTPDTLVPLKPEHAHSQP